MSSATAAFVAGADPKAAGCITAATEVQYVDLYQCHRYDFETPLEETMEALTRAVTSGKVRYIGFFRMAARADRGSSELKNVARFVSSQPQYSLLHREPENGLLSLRLKPGISQVVWSPLAQGVLTGKYLPELASSAHSRAADPRWARSSIPTGWHLRFLEAVQVVGSWRPMPNLLWPVCARVGLRQPNVTSAIVGAWRPSR